MPGHTIESLGPGSFKVQLQDGRIISHHQDHLRKRFTEGPEQSDLPLCEDDMDIVIGASGMTTTTSPQNRTEYQLCRRDWQLLNRTVKLLNRTVKLLHHHLNLL